MTRLKKSLWLLSSTLGLFFLIAQRVSLAEPPGKDKENEAGEGWHFAVSGDSRNCGDVVMPAIAAGAAKNKAAFYWHLGDLRANTRIDEDYEHEPEHRDSPPSKDVYYKTEWDDFIQAQLNPFGSIPVFVGIGNHETYPPKSREQFIIQFADWLDSPVLRAQRLADNPNDHALRSFFHWIQDGVDFIYLDNSTQDQFDAYQLAWFEGVLKRAAANDAVKTVVVGMHAALPDSLASGHSMNDWAVGTASGRQVYADLLNLNHKQHKQVYILSSHSHFFMDGIFASDYWRANGGVLPGWIVGTAGAVRYALPPGAAKAQEARQKVYGYLLGTVHRDRTIDFAFQEIKREDVPGRVSDRYTPAFVDFCFAENTDFGRRTASERKEIEQKEPDKKDSAKP
ncbi:MAG TPA: metallophosphoesterase [Candidatus Angelobacter sp.]|nr:metallophosphoesterase [Candidatus Angelobacter sp.]